MILSSILLALILSLDAMAVSIANGICVEDLSPFYTVMLGLSLWLAFGLLVLVGIKTIQESFGTRDPSSCSDEEKARSDIRDFKTLLLLAVATSLTALAVGLSYSALNRPILRPAAIIGLVTFAVCLAGTEFGKRIGARFERWAGLAGGVILIGLGIRALL